MQPTSHDRVVCVTLVSVNFYKILFVELDGTEVPIIREIYEFFAAYARRGGMGSFAALIAAQLSPVALSRRREDCFEPLSLRIRKTHMNTKDTAEALLRFSKILVAWPVVGTALWMILRKPNYRFPTISEREFDGAPGVVRAFILC